MNSRQHEIEQLEMAIRQGSANVPGNLAVAAPAPAAHKQRLSGQPTLMDTGAARLIHGIINRLRDQLTPPPRKVGWA